ncbi:MAG: hypothetical protein MUO99_05100, partial [Dehalococcoidales bacterium]|nr:hypothetical protein [Dehalococcoidales bacterium]
MSRMLAFLKKLIGRIKEYMGIVWFTLGTIFVPLGFYLLVEKRIIATEAKLMVIGGFVCLV